MLTAVGIPCGPINDVRAGVELATELGLDPVVLAPAASRPYAIRCGCPRPRRATTWHRPELDEHGAEIRAWLKGSPS